MENYDCYNKIGNFTIFRLLSFKTKNINVLEIIYANILKVE